MKTVAELKSFWESLPGSNRFEGYFAEGLADLRARQDEITHYEQLVESLKNQKDEAFEELEIQVRNTAKRQWPEVSK